MIEKEYKVLISEEQYQKIYEWGREWNVNSQINFYYYDLNRKAVDEGLTIRVRSMAKGLFFQIKQTISKIGALSETNEYQKSIVTVPYIITKEQICAVSGIVFEDVYLDGWLYTERRCCRRFEGIEIALDKNIYCDTEDLELEIEFIDERNVPYILSEIKKFGVDFSYSTAGKFTRYVSQRSKGNIR